MDENDRHTRDAQGGTGMDLSMVTIGEKDILRNLVKMYCYEWSQYNGIDIDDNGEYAFENDLDRFFTREKHFPFFVRHEGKLAGFVLIDNDFDYDKGSDYAISEFFVMHKYRRMGIGSQAADEVFGRFPGKWEIKMHPANKISVEFWKSVADRATDGDYLLIEGCEKAKYADGEFGTIISFNNKR